MWRAVPNKFQVWLLRGGLQSHPLPIWPLLHISEFLHPSAPRVAAAKELCFVHCGMCRRFVRFIAAISPGNQRMKICEKFAEFRGNFRLGFYQNFAWASLWGTFRVTNCNNSQARGDDCQTSAQTCLLSEHPGRVALHVSQQISSESCCFSGVAAVSRYAPT